MKENTMKTGMRRINQNIAVGRVVRRSYDFVCEENCKDGPSVKLPIAW